MVTACSYATVPGPHSSEEGRLRITIGVTSPDAGTARQSPGAAIVVASVAPRDGLEEIPSADALSIGAVYRHSP